MPGKEGGRQLTARRITHVSLVRHADVRVEVVHRREEEGLLAVRTVELLARRMRHLDVPLQMSFAGKPLRTLLAQVAQLLRR